MIFLRNIDFQGAARRTTANRLEGRGRIPSMPHCNLGSRIGRVNCYFETANFLACRFLAHVLLDLRFQKGSRENA